MRTLTVYPPVAVGSQVMFAWSAGVHPGGRSCHENAYGRVPPVTWAENVVDHPSKSESFETVNTEMRGV